VGKEIMFVPEYTITTTTPPREYGSILLANGDNVAHLGVQQGWLKVRDGKAKSGQDDDAHEQELDQLHALEEEAQAAERGQWSTKSDVSQMVIQVWEL
jgi:staphylococcal nuclease domain-containing protein 1